LLTPEYFLNYLLIWDKQKKFKISAFDLDHV
jgi:hypothetical protein